MKFEFTEQKISEIVEKISSKLNGRQLGDMVSFNEDGEGLEVIIKKMGKSVLKFKSECVDGKRCFELDKEKIAMTHKPFKDEVTKKILEVIEKSGGTVQS